MKLSLFFSVAVLAFGLTSVRAGEAVYTPPVIPDGTNPAAFRCHAMSGLSKFRPISTRPRGQQYDLIFDGDSITEGWQTRVGQEVWDKKLRASNAVDFGVGGDRTQHVLWRLSKGQVDGMNPKLALLIGTNNMWVPTPTFRLPRESKRLWRNISNVVRRRTCFCWPFFPVTPILWPRCVK